MIPAQFYVRLRILVIRYVRSKMRTAAPRLPHHKKSKVVLRKGGGATMPRSVLTQMVRELKFSVPVRSYATLYTAVTPPPSTDYYAIPETKKKFSRLVAEIEDLQGQINLADRGTSLATAIYEKLVSIWTYHSNAIEGSKLSLGDTIFFLQQGLTVKGKSFKDFLDARNHARAIEFLFSVIDGSQTISPYFLKELNALLLHGTDTISAVDHVGHRISKETTPGEYKKQPNSVLLPDGSTQYYVDPLDVDSEMDYLCEWVNEKSDKIHPIILAAIAHYNFVRIHPFEDGNGRGARIFMNLILIKKRYPPAVIRNEDREEYLSCLRSADQGDLHPFIYFIARSVRYTQTLISEEIEKFDSSFSSGPGLRRPR